MDDDRQLVDRARVSATSAHDEPIRQVVACSTALSIEAHLWGLLKNLLATGHFGCEHVLPLYTSLSLT